MEKHYRVFTILFAIVGFIFMLGGLVFLFINEMYHMTIWWHFVLGMVLLLCEVSVDTRQLFFLTLQGEQ